MVVLPFGETTKRPSAMVGPALLDAERILVCLRYGIGDVVMELPLLDTLRRVVPKARITAIGAVAAIEVLEGAGLVDEVVTYGSWDIEHFWDSGTQDSGSRLLLWLKQAQFDVVLDAPCAPELISDAVSRAGISSLSTDETVLEAALARGANCSEALAVAARSGWELPVTAEARPKIRLLHSEVEFAQAFLDVNEVRRPFVGLCPLASSNLKRWPEAHFAAVADWAIENTSHSAVVFAGDCHNRVNSVRKLMRHGDCCAVIQGLHLRRVAAVLAECATLVTNDTGLMHMAAAVGTPVVAIFGPTSRQVYLPRGRAVGLSSNLECPHRARRMKPPGCWANEQCLIAPDNCTMDVDPETVITALQEMLHAVARERELC